MKKKKTVITIMCGLPRSGKSTWIKNNKRDAVIVSPDDIRKEVFGHQFHSPANKFVFAIAEAMAILLIKQGKDVIIDATHMTESTRSQWVYALKDIDCCIQVVWVHTFKDISKQMDVCLSRNSLSPKDEQLPVDVLKGFEMVFYPPNKVYGYDVVEYISRPRRKAKK